MKTLIMLVALFISFNAYSYSVDCNSLVVLDKDVSYKQGTVKVSDGNSILYIIRADKKSGADIMSALKDQVGELQQYTEWSWGNDKALVEEFKDHTRAYVYEQGDYGLRQKAEICKIEEVEFDL